MKMVKLLEINATRMEHSAEAQGAVGGTMSAESARSKQWSEDDTHGRS